MFKHTPGLRAALMIGASMMAVLAAGQASAQAAGNEVDEVVIVGRPIAESEAAALLVQKESPSLVSVLSADAAGRLPDQNIAFAIGRLPGVAVERDQGQARYVNLRGSKITWTTVSYDGLNVVSPEGRATRFDNIPSALATQVVVTKAITADMSSDTVAGNVNIITKSPLAQRGFHFSGKASVGSVQLGGGEETDLVLTVSKTFMDDKFGVLATVSRYFRNMVTDNFETDPYQTAGGVRDRRPGYETRRWAREYENKLYRLTRANTGAALKFAYEPDANNNLFFSSIYNNYEDTELRNNYIFRMDNGAATVTGDCPAIPAPQTTSGFADICSGSNTPTKGTVYGAQITENFNSLESAEYTWTNTLGGEHKWAGWDVSWRLNYTETEDGIDAPARSNFASGSNIADRPTVDYDFTDNAYNTVKLYRTVVTGSVRSKGAAVASIDSFLVPPVSSGNAVSTTNGGDPTFAYTGKFDISRDAELFGSPLKVKFGGFYSVRTKKHQEVLYGATAAALAAGGKPFSYDLIRNDKTFQGQIQLGYTFTYFTKSAIDGYVNQALRAGLLTRQNTNANYYRVQEDILAGYAMGTLEQDWGNIVFGARVEQTKNTGQAFATIAGAQQLITTSKEDTLVFPSAHLNYNLNPNMRVRVGLTTGASRPDFDELRPNFIYDDGLQSVSGGNPDAGPEKAVGVDAYFEWYMQPQGYFSAGVYYKSLTDVLFTQSGLFGRTILNTPGTDRSGYTFTTIRNGGDGYIKGLELAYSQSLEPYFEKAGLPSWMGGFGLQGNVTINDTEMTVPAVSGVPARNVPLQGASDLVYNISVYYEKYGLSARLAYQFRTEWGQSTGDYQVLNGKVVPVTNGDIYWDDDEELDFSVRYRINKNFEWHFDAANLTDQAGYRYGDTVAFPIERETFGRRYLTGIRWTF